MGKSTSIYTDRIGKRTNGAVGAFVVGGVVVVPAVFCRVRPTQKEG
jgi:hypothetical protein